MPLVNWILEGIVNWISGIVTKVMDAVSGLFLNALGTDMTAMEEYFPFIGKAFTIMQYIAWALLFLITVWQLFRAIGGPITEAENPYVLTLRAVLFAVLIYFAKPIFIYVLSIAKAPYTALMDVTMSGEDFTFSGIETKMRDGLTVLISDMSVVGAILITVLIIALGWNYFKLLLEVVERYIVVGVLCYTSPLSYSMGASKTTNQVFRSWIRMVGSQLLLLVMNVWFLRGFNSSVGQYIGNGGGLTNGNGSIFLWLFCALAFLKTAQKFDSYLASIGLNAAQTGSNLGMEIIAVSRVIGGAAGNIKTAGKVFGGAGTVKPSGGIFAGFANRFTGNSYVRDAVVSGGTKMGAGGITGFVGRAFGSLAAKNGATLSGNSISSVANKLPMNSGTIAGDIANRSLENFMPHLKGKNLSDTNITGGKITGKIKNADGSETLFGLYSADQYNTPNSPHNIVTASDGGKWYQMASGSFSQSVVDSNVSGITGGFVGLQNGTDLRYVGNGVIEANGISGSSLLYSSAFYEEPDVPHTVYQSSDGLDWYSVNKPNELPEFEQGSEADEYNRAQMESFMPGFDKQAVSVSSDEENGCFEVRHDDGSGTKFYDANIYDVPHGNYSTYEDVNGNKWYAISGESAVERKPVYEDGHPVYDGDRLRTKNVELVRYRGEPSKFAEPKTRSSDGFNEPRRKA